MMPRSFFIMLCALFLAISTSAALAAESDPNLCYAGQAWAGQCTTQRHWEAGWCYANGDEAACDALYGDVASYMSGATPASATTTTGVAGVAGGAQGQSQGGNQQQGSATATAVGGGQQQQGQQNQQQQQNQQNQQQQNCSPSVSYGGLSSGTYSFSVNKCGKSLSPVPTGTFWGKYLGNASGDGCWVYLYEKTDSDGNLTYSQLWWSVHDRSTSCTGSNVSVS